MVGVCINAQVPTVVAAHPLKALKHLTAIGYGRRVDVRKRKVAEELEPGLTGVEADLGGGALLALSLGV